MTPKKQSKPSSSVKSHVTKAEFTKAMAKHVTKTEFTSAMGKIDQRFDSMEKEFRALRTDFNALRTDFNGQGVLFENLESKMDLVLEACSPLLNRVTEHEERITKLETAAPYFSIK